MDKRASRTSALSFLGSVTLLVLRTMAAKFQIVSMQNIIFHQVELGNAAIAGSIFGKPGNDALRRYAVKLVPLDSSFWIICKVRTFFQSVSRNVVFLGLLGRDWT